MFNPLAWKSRLESKISGWQISKSKILNFKNEDFPNPVLKGSFLVTTCVGILTGLIHWLKIIKYHINRQYNIIIKSYQPAAQTYPDPNPKLKKRQHCHTMGIDLCWRISLTHWGRIFIFYFNYSAWNCSKYQLSTPSVMLKIGPLLALQHFYQVTGSRIYSRKPVRKLIH